MKNIWFTSDLHLGHANIIKHCSRPFPDVDTMNLQLIQRWNEVVQEEDDVYLLGDVGFGNAKNLLVLIQSLKGQIFLIRGNHDEGLIKGELAKRFTWIKDRYELRIKDPSVPRGEIFIILDHYPLLAWNRSYHKSWHLHGHSHGSYNTVNEKTMRLDVGVDSWNYAPVSLEQLKLTMLAKSLLI
jgi:calcineurin-like phosphoesterase family protein